MQKRKKTTKYKVIVGKITVGPLMSWWVAGGFLKGTLGFRNPAKSHDRSKNFENTSSDRRELGR